MEVRMLIIFIYWNAVHGTEIERNNHSVTWNKSVSSWDIVERAARFGLLASEHSVRTEDGYVLQAFHVHGPGPRVGPPVFLMHGVMQTGNSWLDAGDASLAVLLAATGRDVWLGNTRGSYYSRRHEWLHPDTDASFWHFSADEIGRLDLPAFIDCILNTTGTDKVDYIGFSQGGSTFFIMCSELPQYCDKVNLMIALAPAARLRGMKSFASIAFEFFEKTEEVLSKNGIWEVLPQGGLIQSFSKTVCNLPEFGLRFCEIIKSIYDAPHPGSVTKSTFLMHTANFPAGSSVHNMARYSQNMRSKYFQKFDYGPEQNLIFYGNKTAPAYNLSAVTVPTVLIYSRNDRLVDVSNMKWLIKQLPNLVEAFPVEDPMWTHMDFTMSRDIPKYVFPTIIKYLDKYNQ